MKIRQTLAITAMVAVSALLALVWGPGMRARGRDPGGRSRQRSMRSVAEAFALVEKNFADPISSEKAFYQGAIPGMLHTLDPALQFRRSRRIPRDAAPPARPVLRRRHADRRGYRP